MADSAKVRLVRCPKCQNLLPELADYTVYQCGGCGAVLRAKDKNCPGDGASQKSEEAQLAAAVTSELQNSLEKGAVELSDSTSDDVDVNSNVGSLSCDEKNLGKDDAGDDGCNNSRIESKTASGNLDVKISRDNNLSGSPAGSDFANLNSEIKHTSKSWRSGQMPVWENGEGSEMEGLGRVMRTEVEGVRFSTSNYPDEGPSNYNLESSYGYGESLWKHDDHDGANRVQRLEKDRVELLRKLDELKEQLSRSCDVADKPKEKVILNGRMAPSNPYTSSDSDPWFTGGSTMPERASTQFFGSDKHAARPPYFHHNSDPFAYTNGHEMAMHNYLPSMQKSNHIPGFGDPFGVKRGPHHLSGQYPSHPYFSRHYFDASSDSFEPYTSSANFHHPSCSCFHCYERHHGITAPVPPTGFGHKRFPDVLNNPMLFQHEKPGAFDPHVHSSRPIIPPTDFRGSHPHGRWSSDVTSEMSVFGRSRPRRVVLASGGRSCRPVVGGAPFLTCFNCFEVLEVPKKVLLLGKNKKKIQCGSCSTLINLGVTNKKLVLSANAKVTQLPTEVYDTSAEMIKESASYSHGRMGRMNANFSSDDYDNSGYDFQTVETDPIALLPGQGLNSTMHQEMNGFHTSSLSTSEDENSPDATIGPREIINCIQQPIKASLSPPPPGSPLQQYFDYSSNNHLANRFGKGNQSSRSDQEKVMPNKATRRQNSMKDASLATEIEVPFHEYSNTGASQDSNDANGEDSQLKPSKGGESFFANIIKKSFKDLSRSNQTDELGRHNVSVNGHVISDRLVKKAEKSAGPIHPGQYWYDCRAGFWGAMGGPCLGIIPPYIEEFNHPIPEDCSGGNTGVYVNGRELHQRDLDLLAGRGLPSDKDRSYIVEISGRVLDEDTGEELESLGKLAPTVEKVKHGFGMKALKVGA